MHRAVRILMPIMLLGTGTAMISWRMPVLNDGVAAAPDSVQAERPLAPADWVAAGPGQIEPISGEHRICSETPGNVVRLFVRAGGRVQPGQLLAIVDDREQQARLRAAEAEVAFRESEREAAVTSSVFNTRRDAEDKVATLEAEVRHKQEALDEIVIAARQLEEIERMKTELTASAAKLAEARRALREQETGGTAPRPTRTESALQLARAELGVAYAAFEKTRIRAPSAGTVLHVAKLAGDLVTPAVEDPIVTLGDVSRLRARVEAEEANLNDIKEGQSVTIKSDAFPDREFQGRISQIGASVRPRRLASQNASLTPRDTSVDILVELDAGAPLLPGMRVDAYFQPISLSQDNGDHHASNQSLGHCYACRLACNGAHCTNSVRRSRRPRRD